MTTEAKRIGAEKLLAALPVPGVEGDREAGWAREARAGARARILGAGAPTKRDEYWKYTDPAPLTAPLAPAGAAGDAPHIHPFGENARARFVNGLFRADLSSAPKGAVCVPLSEALRRDLGIARTLFGVLEARGQEKVARPLAALNTACATDGLVVQATETATLHLVQDHIGEGASLLHHLIRVESGAELTLLESGTTANTAMEVDLAEGAIFHHVRLQTGARTPSATHIFARVAGGASFKTFTFSTDGGLTRNEIVMELTGDDASGHIAGTVMARNGGHIDNTVFVTHDAANCKSRQVFKNVMAEGATGVFQGKIYVGESGQKTDGYQISQSVLLDDDAEFLVKPELEIYADDVACSHGSTTGPLDEEALFYLCSRGVPRAEAETMLVSAFVDEAIGEIEGELPSGLMREQVAVWMAGK